MADAAEGEPYGLTTPAVKKTETITSQFQREILGDLANASPVQHPRDESGHKDDASVTRDDIEISSPETFAKRASTAAGDKQMQQVEQQEEASSAATDTHTDSSNRSAERSNRRHTLSPSKASAFFSTVTDSDISRRDTVSPSALKTLLHSIAENEQSGGDVLQVLQRKQQQPSTDTEAADGSDLQGHLLDQNKTKEQQEASKMELLQGQLQTPSQKSKKDDRTLSPSEAANVSGNETLSGSKAKGKSPGRYSKRAAKSASSAITKDNDSFTDAFFSANLLSQQDEDVDNEHHNAASSAEKKSRRSTLEPTDAEAMLSELRSGIPEDISKVVKTHPTTDQPKQATENRSRISLSPVTRSKSRRATVDPSMIDDLINHEEKATTTTASNNRRETIDDHGLLELNGAYDSDDNVRDRKKAKTLVSPTKPQEMNEPMEELDGNSSPPNGAVTTMEKKEVNGLKRPLKSPTPRKQARFRSDSRNSNTQTVGVVEQTKDDQSGSSMLSPGQPTTRLKTPLKGILSAKKRKKGQTTPTKSVNFGPSQGAEFNFGSPSTSMTPMCSKEAREMFPLDRPSPPSSPQVEDDPDDLETSLNTSLLDEADSRDSEDEVKEDSVILKPSYIASSLLTAKSAEKNRRRYSLRGVSPLDNQANARRQRRASMNVTNRNSSTITNGLLATVSTRSSTMKSSFVSTSEVIPQSRLAYADSSASSIEMEDMEITGDYSTYAHAASVLQEAGSAEGKKKPISQIASSPTVRQTSFRTQPEQKQSNPSLFEDSPVEDDNTVELGSLGDLIAESALYAAGTNDDVNAPRLGSLSDLANEGMDTSDQIVNTFRRFSSTQYSRLEEQETTLDPVQEVDEDGNSSSRHSMMSLESSDLDDQEYNERRKSLVVNLSSEFERVGSGTPPKTHQSPQKQSKQIQVQDNNVKNKSPEPAVPPVELISMEKLLSLVNLENIGITVDSGYQFYETPAANIETNTHTTDEIKISCSSTTCTELVQWYADEISSWSTGLTDVLASLLNEKAPALFSPDNFNETCLDAIRALHATEATSVRSGWCSWRTKMEKQMTDALTSCANELANDVKTLKAHVSNDAMKRQSEIAAIQELIEREKQMALLLDAIEEQQAVRNEYAATVEGLESQCASLTLEESVLQRKLNAMEGEVSLAEPVTKAASIQLQQQVLEREEMYKIHENLSAWRVGGATSSHLKLSTYFDDIMFGVDINADITFETASDNAFSTNVIVNEKLKRRKRSVYLPTDEDVVVLVQRQILHPNQLSRFVAVRNQEAFKEDRDSSTRLCMVLQGLECFISRSFRFLRELRSISCQFAVRYSTESNHLWVSFAKFPSVAMDGNKTGLGFTVGFTLTDEFPFTNFETHIEVQYGKISVEQIQKEIQTVPRQSHEYVYRVCRWLHDAFVL